MTLFIRGKIRPETGIRSTVLQRIYEPVVSFVLARQKTVIVGAVIVVVITIYPFLKLDGNSCRPSTKATLFYMPVTVPRRVSSRRSPRSFNSRTRS